MSNAYIVVRVDKTLKKGDIPQYGDMHLDVEFEKPIQSRDDPERIALSMKVDWIKHYDAPSIFQGLMALEETRDEVRSFLNAVFNAGMLYQRQHPEVGEQLELVI